MERDGWKWVGICAAALLLAAGFWVGSRRCLESQHTFQPVRSGGETLVLDAGHGGEDGGAVSLTGTPESGINLSIVLKMEQLLAFCGDPPVVLRREDRSLHDASAQTLRQKKASDLHNRAAAVSAIEHAALISIHQNAYPNEKYHGAQVFYANGSLSLPLAQRTQELLRVKLDPSNERVAKPIPDHVYLMNHISCPAILVECGFLTNAEEEEKLRTGEYQTKLATVLCAAWLQEANSYDK